MSQYKGLFKYATFKGVEVVLTSSITLILAKKIGPNQYGLLLPILLYITYANYISFGVNQVVVKNYSRIKQTTSIESFLGSNLKILFFTFVINIFLTTYIFHFRQNIIIASISTLIILRGFFSSYFRAVDRIYILNYVNISYSVLLLGLVFIWGNTITNYLNFWALSIFVACIIYFLYDRAVFQLIFINALFKFNSQEIRRSLLEGVKLGLTGILTTILLTYDRLIINSLNINPDVKGSYQLADNFGTAFYIVFTTIIFFYYPRWIEKLRENPEFRITFTQNIKKVVAFIPFVLMISFFLAKVINSLIFPEFIELEIYITLSIFIKCCTVSTALTSILYISKDKEKKYLKRAFILILPIFLIIYLLSSKMPIWLIPIITGSTVLSFTFLSLEKSKSLL